jgi:hypothetical protein
LFDDPAIDGWPDEPGSVATSERVVYRLVTGKRIEVGTSSDLHDDRLWRQLLAAIEDRSGDRTAAALSSIAHWWLAEYRATDTPAFDPEHFASFEPTPNAVMALASIRDGLHIKLRSEEARAFYFVAEVVARG